MSNLTQFAPFAGGGLKSFQTGYIGIGASGGSGEDTCFTDVTISAVTVAKSIAGFYGACSNNGFTQAFYALDTSSGAASGIVFPRLTSTTNIRLSSNTPFAGASSRLSGRWQVAEAN